MARHAPAGTGSDSSLALFFLLSWLHMLWLTRLYLDTNLVFAGGGPSTAFHLAAWLCYSLFYLLPAALIPPLFGLCGASRRRLPAALCACATATLSLLLVRVDSMVYELYAFHINSFVLNLIVTPGGIASLGSGTRSFLSFGLLVAGIAVLQALFLVISLRLPRLRGRVRALLWSAGLGFGALFLVQGTVYGLSDLGNYGPVLDGSKAFPFFQRIRFRSLARRFGFEHRQRSEFSIHDGGTALRYPRAEVPFTPPAARPNIVVLVAESLRWDQLNPETMPNTWAFSQAARRFEQHHSSGNGTREGLFGMFYGLYGSYWERFMTARQPPLLMTRLRELGYAIEARTGATFTYPEFDRTLFTGMPLAHLHTARAAAPAWLRDADNTDALLSLLDSRAPDQPFFEFLFFESTHAPYSFPEETALDRHYADELDYASLSRASLAANIGPIYARYRNAAHWVDVQLGRIYGELERRGLLGNTIVIVTGDHGEEFMEKGAWGHNSAFVEEQTHVPLVLAMPGAAAGVIERQTSHLDIASTLLPMLGAGGDPQNYTLGAPLLEPGARPPLVLSDWHSIGVLTPELKYRIPYLNLSGADYWAPTDAADRPLDAARSAALIARHRDTILEIMRNCTLFTARAEGS